MGINYCNVTPFLYRILSFQKIICNNFVPNVIEMIKLGCAKSIALLQRSAWVTKIHVLRVCMAAALTFWPITLTLRVRLHLISESRHLNLTGGGALQQCLFTNLQTNANQMC